MGVKVAEQRLVQSALEYGRAGDLEPLFREALLSRAQEYGKAKAQAQRSRDEWKAKKRLGTNGR